MTVLTAPIPVTYDDLPADVRDAFDDAMELALDAPDNGTYFAAQRLAAHVLGIDLPPSGEITRCTCRHCPCSRIFDAAHARTYLPGDGATEVVQCPDCGTNHRHTD